MSKASRGSVQDHKTLDVIGDASEPEQHLCLLGRLQPCRERLAAATLDHRHDALDLSALAVGGAICGIVLLPNLLTISCRYGVVVNTVVERRFLAGIRLSTPSASRQKRWLTSLS
jgi:hypothetical protein